MENREEYSLLNFHIGFWNFACVCAGEKTPIFKANDQWMAERNAGNYGDALREKQVRKKEVPVEDQRMGTQYIIYILYIIHWEHDLISGILKNAIIEV